MILGTVGIDQSHSVVAKTLSFETGSVFPKCSKWVAGLVQSAVRGCKRDWPHDKSCLQ